MNRVRENPGSGSADKKAGKDSHLTDKVLLLAVDGELPVGEGVRVRAHLEACWSCRVRQEQIEQAIADVVEYRNHLLKPFLPPPASGRGMFVALLGQLADETGRPSLWRRVVGGLRAVLAVAVPTRAAWITAVVVAGLGLIVFTLSRESPTVSASELLQRAQASEVATLRSVSQPVVYQKLRIRKGRQTVTRTVYRDPVRSRQADHLDASEKEETELRQAFRNARLSWEDPLSAASYSAWRNSVRQEQDEVTRDGNDFLTLKTTTPEGSVAQAVLKFRAADYHPVAENLWFRDDTEIDVTELAYEVLNFEAINPAIFAPEIAAPSQSPQPAPRVAPVPSEADLAEAELRARLALHVTQADLGEQIDLVRNAQGRVVVRGLIGTSERKKELLAALQRIPHVESQLQTVEEAGAKLPARARADTPVVIAVEPVPALQETLVERFPDAEERAAFVNQALGLAQDAVAHAWALRRIEERYTPEELARLSSSSRQTLGLVVRDHVAALQQQVGAERRLIGPLLPPGSDVGPTPAAADNWRAALTQIFPLVQKIQDDLAALLAGSGTTPADPDALVSEVQLVLEQLEAEVPLLYQQVNGPFLKAKEEKP